MTLALLSYPESKRGKETIKAALTDCDQSNPQVGYIASEPDIDRRYFRQTQQVYEEFGASLSVYLELEDAFDEAAFEQLLTLNAIHLSGGNTYRFLCALKQRNLMPALIDYVEQGGILIGVSAGAMIMTPSIVTASLCGDVNHVGLQELSGLGLTPFTFVPHSEKLGKDIIAAREMVNSEGVKCYLCSNDEGILLRKGQARWQLFGEPVLVI
ncbi:Type 1 glutamine amidotransferase-like domain-containing protein [uncultured Shewanella sp.]|uniref:Type 1 glutamine amidotransferase-like domain-containing protein n=1 Tax=uncultured Shewanella sp. TaxID=173975 RepID=UPI0026214BE6|nr:Type 1 glutamine amidotransferase-like domain-containing protein [uncultured Shewanella sp.]